VKARLQQNTFHPYLTVSEIAMLNLFLGRREPALAVLKQVGAPAKVLDSRLELIAKLRQRDGLNVYDGRVKLDAEFWKTCKQRGVSPTALEEYQRCPYRYLIQQVMRIEPLEVPERERSTQDWRLGKLYHKILHAIYQQLVIHLRMAKKTADLDKKWAEVERIIEQQLSEFAQQQWTGYPLVWELLAQEVRQLVKEFVSRDWQRLAQERLREILTEQEAQAVIALPGGANCRWYGIMDRLEVVEDENTLRIRVVDYKSGKPKSRDEILKEVKGLHFLQPPVYLWLAAQLVRTKLLTGDQPGITVQLEDVLLVYLKQLKEGTEQFEPVKFTYDDLRQQEGSLLDGLKQLLEQIRAGYFPIRPDERGVCGRCRLKRICRLQHTPTRQRVQRWRKHIIPPPGTGSGKKGS
jgi:RecB family exonuclease